MLTATTKKKFRSIGHNLKPVIIIGAKGLSNNVLDELNNALDVHELIKVKIAEGERDSRAEAIHTLCDKSGAELIQTIGKIALIFRPSKKALYPIK